MLGKKGRGIAANQYTYGAKCSDETRKKLSQSTTEINKTRWADPANIAKHSAAMRQAVLDNPESYQGAVNKGRIKIYVIDGVKLQGRWEVDFYLWAKEAGLNPIRNTRSFPYNYNGIRSYFPDFYIESLDLYVEVKGYETDRDLAKWRDFPNKLCIIREKQIKQIRQGTFVGL